LPCTVVPCSAGQYRGQCGRSSDSQCLECPAGTYKIKAGNDPKLCTPCPENTFSSTSGSDDAADCIACASASICNNMSYSSPGSKDMDSCICPFSIRHPLLVSAAIILVCGLLAWRVLLCEESRRRGGGANREGDRLREQLLEAAAGDDPIPNDILCPITMEADAAENECCICFKVGKLLALVPCGHRCLCADCSARVVGHNCPVCRTEARQAIRVFD
jgi:hypothetical protein